MINVMLIQGLLGHVRYNNILSLDKIVLFSRFFCPSTPKREAPESLGVMLEYYYGERALLRFAQKVK